MKKISIPDETDKKILELLCQGYAPKEIAHKLWKKPGAIYKRLFSLRKYYNCNTTNQLISKYNILP